MWSHISIHYTNTHNFNLFLFYMYTLKCVWSARFASSSRKHLSSSLYMLSTASIFFVTSKLHLRLFIIFLGIIFVRGSFLCNFGIIIVHISSVFFLVWRFAMNRTPLMCYKGFCRGVTWAWTEKETGELKKAGLIAVHIHTHTRTHSTCVHVKV